MVGRCASDEQENGSGDSHCWVVGGPRGFIHCTFIEFPARVPSAPFSYLCFGWCGSGAVCPGVDAFVFSWFVVYMRM